MDNRAVENCPFANRLDYHSKNIELFQGSCPVDKTIKMLEFFHFFCQGFVFVPADSTRFMVQACFLLRFFPVFCIRRQNRREKLTITSFYDIIQYTLYKETITEGWA